LKLYVFWTNPLNYVGLAVTGLLSIGFRVLFKIYGKDAKIFTKKIAATASKPTEATTMPSHHFERGEVSS
jgi:hypothetical protein